MTGPKKPSHLRVVVGANKSGMPPPKAKPSGGGGGPPNNGGLKWHDLLTWTGANIAPTVHNIHVILQHEPEWKGVIKYDEFAQRVVFVREPPFEEYKPMERKDPHAGEDPNLVVGSNVPRKHVGRGLTDQDVTRTTLWLERKYRIKFTSKQVGEAISAVAETDKFHPVKSYLEKLVWDGIERIGRSVSVDEDNGSTSWLHTYFGVEDTQYSRDVGRWWLISAIARIYLPGCPAQHMLVLEGNQGRGKSRALRALADPWFSEDLPDTTSKDALQQMTGVWIMEVPEMDAIHKGGHNAAKKFITKAVDRYRPPYGHMVKEFPRQCIFCGTTNQKVYLGDATGNRRYWPVWTTDIDVKAIERDRGQIFAEALLAFKAGELWHPSEIGQVEMLREQQEDRTEQDIWTDLVSSWIQNRRGFGKQFTAGDVLAGLQMDPTKWTSKEQARVDQIVTQLGYVRGTRLIPGTKHKQFFYDLPENVTASQLPPAPSEPPPAPEAFVPPLEPEQRELLFVPEDDWEDLPP